VFESGLLGRIFGPEREREIQEAEENLIMGSLVIRVLQNASHLLDHNLLKIGHI
jgi:hypothetical protein